MTALLTLPLMFARELLRGVGMGCEVLFPRERRETETWVAYGTPEARKLRR